MVIFSMYLEFNNLTGNGNHVKEWEQMTTWKQQQNELKYLKPHIDKRVLI